VDLLKEEGEKQPVAEASRKVAFILLNDTLDSVRDSLVLDSKIADFRQIVWSAQLKVVLNAYSSFIRDSGKQEEALSVLLEVNEKLSDFTGFSNVAS